MSKVAEVARDIRRGWWILCTSYAAELRDVWARYEADWERDTEPGYPITKTARQRRDLALALADLLDAIGGTEVRR